MADPNGSRGRQPLEADRDVWIRAGMLVVVNMNVPGHQHVVLDYHVARSADRNAAGASHGVADLQPAVIYRAEPAPGTYHHVVAETDSLWADQRYGRVD